MAKASSPTAAFNPEACLRKLVHTIPVASLATLEAESGHPFVTLVNVAFTPEKPAFILLLSALSAHTQHLDADPRSSLLLVQGGKGDALAHPRLTLTGQSHRIMDKAARETFLQQHPKAALYADFADFSFWSFAPQSAHLNGGFAKAARFERERLSAVLRFNTLPF
jgi:heme iron utilization protein